MADGSSHEPNLEKKLNELAAQSGRTAEALVRHAVAGLVEDLREIRDTLDSRYDDVKSGRVQILPRRPGHRPPTAAILICRSAR